MKKVKVLLYCTKAKPYLYKHFKGDYLLSNTYDKLCINNGKIVAECDCEKVEDFSKWENDYYQLLTHIDLYAGTNGDYQFLNKYLKGEKKGYAIHLSNLNIFDKPRELNEYYSGPKKVNSFNGPAMVMESIDKTPQNMCRVYDEQENMYVLISIRPEWLCKILNGEKTIEVRRKVLNCMKI